MLFWRNLSFWWENGFRGLIEDPLWCTIRNTISEPNTKDMTTSFKRHWEIVPWINLTESAISCQFWKHNPIVQPGKKPQVCNKTIENGLHGSRPLIIPWGRYRKLCNWKMVQVKTYIRFPALSWLPSQGVWEFQIEYGCYLCSKG